jgi:DNA repair exonuclease SbcCD ATPase subunit
MRQGNGSGERQETSVMVSIQEILQEATRREQEERLEQERCERQAAEQRLERIRREEQERAAHARAEDEERERRAHEEQRRRAELEAMQEAAVQRARMEAAARARLAEALARQEHERQLSVIARDAGKKRLKRVAVGLGLLAAMAAAGAGFAVKRTLDERTRAEAETAQLRAKVDDAEAQKRELERQLRSASDPAQVRDLERRLQELQDRIVHKTSDPPRAAPRAPATPRDAPPGKSPKPVCTCAPHDPVCTCLE